MEKILKKIFHKLITYQYRGPKHPLSSGLSSRRETEKVGRAGGGGSKGRKEKILELEYIRISEIPNSRNFKFQNFPIPKIPNSGISEIQNSRKIHLIKMNPYHNSFSTTNGALAGKYWQRDNDHICLDTPNLSTGIVQL